MSIFSIIGIMVFAVVVIVGTILKIIFWKQRKKLEGCHGYIHKEEFERSKTDDWKSL